MKKTTTAKKTASANSRSTSNKQRSASQGSTRNRSDRQERAQAQGRTTQRSGTPRRLPQNGLVKLFNHQLADLYYVEKQLLKTLPSMSRKANDRRLRRAFDAHQEETQQHVERLEQVFAWLDMKPRAQRCEAMDGILAEAKSMMDDFKDDQALDAAMVCAAQKVEHYEITSYGSLCAFAEQLGWDKVCDLLEDTLDEEKAADHKLSMLAEQVLNYEAQEGEATEEDEKADASAEEEDEEGGADAEDDDESPAKKKELTPA